MNSICRPVCLLTAVLVTLVSPAVAAVDPAADGDVAWSHGTSSPPAQSEDAAYAAGTRAMNDGRWSDAVAAFEQVGSGKGRRADAALYWKAYALTKVGKADLANATCVQLRTQYEGSRWNRDCAALPLTQGSNAGRAPSPKNATTTYSQYEKERSDASSKDANAELKILALNSLMHRDAAQAIPLLRAILMGDQTDAVKKHALFVLAQSRSPEADALMRDLVLGKMGSDLQRQGIQACGVYQGQRSGEMLAEAYRSSMDSKVKRAVVSALFVAGNDARLVDLARGEKDLELKRTIVSQLALMNGRAASDYMLELLK